ncbi:MAG: PAS domain-containing protein, partial [Pseudomonadota bacterium]
MKTLARWLPQSLFGRLMLVLATGLALALGLSAIINAAERDQLVRRSFGMQPAQRITDVVKLLDALPPAERQRVVAVFGEPPLVLSLHAAPLIAEGVAARGRSGLFAASTAALVLTAGTFIAAGHGVGAFYLSESADGIGLLVGYVCSLLAIPMVTTALTGEIAANEQRWQMALDVSKIGIGDWDLRAGRIEFSPRWLALLGHASQSFGRSPQAFWSLLHPDDARAVHDVVDPLRNGKALTARVECRLQCRNGRWKLFELNALVSEHGPRGEPLRVITTARDISEVQSARESQAVSNSVFQHLHEGLLITDPQHRVIDANPTYCEITGYTREELIGTVPELLNHAQ